MVDLLKYKFQVNEFAVYPGSGRRDKSVIIHVMILYGGRGSVVIARDPYDTSPLTRLR